MHNHTLSCTCSSTFAGQGHARAARACVLYMFGVDLKRIASASGLGTMLGLGGGPSASERPRNSDGAGPSVEGREDDEDEETSHEKMATTNLISAGHESFELIFMMLMGIRTSEAGYGLSLKFVYVQWIGEKVKFFPRSKALELHPAVLPSARSPS